MVKSKDKSNDEVITEKFCRKVSEGDKEINRVCITLTKKILSNKDGTPDLDAIDKLSEITGLSEEELIEMLTKSCPGCPD